MASEATWNPALWEAAGGRIPDGWSLVPFGDLLTSPKAIAVGVMYPGDDVPSGVPLIRVGDVQNGGIVGEPQMRISGQVHEEYRRTELKGDELLITLVGKPGACVLARPSMKGWNVARALAVARLQDPSLRPFIKTVLEGPVMRSIISGMLNTTVQPTLNLKEIRSLPVPVPGNHREAQELGEVAELFNARIDLLRQTNATLESIAQALFKSWFIDFDPVRAKAEGREPEGMDAATAALFPAEFEESALGLIPKGWRVRRIEELALKVAMGPFGSNIKVATFVEEGVPVVSGQHLRGTLLEDSEFNFITEEHAQRLSGSLVKNGDIVLTHAGNIGQVALIPTDSAYRSYVLSQRQFYLRCNPDLASPEHLCYFLRSKEGQHVLLANASQVGVPSIARPASYLKSIQVIAPTIAVANAFAEVARATHLSIGSARRRIACLEQLRDTLLPRLISGKLRLPEARAQVEEVLA